MENNIPENSSPKIMNKKTYSLIVIVIAIILGFFGGLQYEKNKISGTIGNLNESGESDIINGVDFTLFWDVWNLINTRYVNKDNLDSTKLMYGAIGGLVDSLEDPYTVFFEPVETKAFSETINGEFAGVGIEIGIRKELITVIAPLPDTPAQKAGLLSGDVIVGIDDTPTDSIALHEAVDKIRGKKGTTVKLTISRKNEKTTRDFTLTRDTIKIPAVRVTMLEKNGKKIAHLQVFTFNKNVDSEFSNASKELIKNGTDGIILDLRNNPGGLLDSAVNLSSYFMDPNKTVVIEHFSKDNENVFKTSRNASLKNIPVVILINGGSASASEILAGALKDNNGVKLIGETTFGKGSVQQVEDLKFGTSLKITIAKWLTPKGISINEEGIKPDFEVKRTTEDIQNDKDPQLDKAVEILNKM